MSGFFAIVHDDGSEDGQARSVRSACSMLARRSAQVCLAQNPLKRWPKKSGVIEWPVNYPGRWPGAATSGLRASGALGARDVSLEVG